MRFAVQSLLWSLEFGIQINPEHNTITIKNLAQSEVQYLNIVNLTFNFHVKTSHFLSIQNLQSSGFAIIAFSLI